MLDGLELLDGVANGFGGGSGEARGADRGQHILDVVLALEGNLAEGHDRSQSARPRVSAIDDVAVLDPCALLDRVLQRKPIDRGVGTGGGGGGADVVGVQHHEVVRVLRGKDALLGQRVVLESAVAVEVVGRDVEDDGDVGMELLRAFELKAGNLEHRPGLVGALVDEGHDRHADVAADQGGNAGLFQDFAEQRGGGGFAVGAGDGEDLAFEKARGQFQFADDGQAEAA